MRKLQNTACKRTLKHSCLTNVDSIHRVVITTVFTAEKVALLIILQPDASTDTVVPPFTVRTLNPVVAFFGPGDPTLLQFTHYTDSANDLL